MSKLCQYIKESSLSRILSHNEKHDCGALTAFRKKEGCGLDSDREYTHKEKQQRNKSLRVKLMSLGYSVTNVNGRYPEGGKTLTEESFFVVDHHDTGKLRSDLIKLGEEFQQDSVLFIPKGSTTGQDQAYLIGTNKCSNNDLGYGKTFAFSKGKFGTSSPIYTTYVNGRPMIFEETGIEVCRPQTGMGLWALHSMAKKEWKELDVD